jgi:hypothetical protein
MIDSDAHPTPVGGRILDTLGSGLPQRLVHAVIHAYPLGIALRTPVPTPVLDVADPFLLLRVHRDEGLSPVLKILDPTVTRPKRCVPIRMTGACLGFLMARKAITQVIQPPPSGG